MAQTNFQSLDQVRQALKQYESMTLENKDTLVGLGALTVLASAMLKIVEEIELLKTGGAGDR